MLAEVILRSSLKAVDTMAEVYLISVKGKNLLLGKSMLNLNGEQGLLQLAAKGALVIQKEIAGELHGESRGALCAGFRRKVVICRPQHAEDVDAPMALEIFVFDRDDGFAQQWREIIVVDGDAPLQGKRTKDASMRVVKLGDGVGTVAHQVVNLGKIDGVDQHEPAEGANGDSQDNENGDGDAAGNFAPPFAGMKGVGRWLGILVQSVLPEKMLFPVPGHH